MPSRLRRPVRPNPLLDGRFRIRSQAAKLSRQRPGLDAGSANWRTVAPCCLSVSQVGGPGGVPPTAPRTEFSKPATLAWASVLSFEWPVAPSVSLAWPDGLSRSPDRSGQLSGIPLERLGSESTVSPTAVGGRSPRAQKPRRVGDRCVGVVGSDGGDLDLLRTSASKPEASSVVLLGLRLTARIRS